MTPIVLNQSGLDDTAQKEEADRFIGMDMASKPTALDPRVLRGGANMWTDQDLLKTRPGLRIVSALSAATLNPPGIPRIRGYGYYDTPSTERLLTVWNGEIYESPSTEFNVGATKITGISFSAGTDIRFTQLVDMMFFTDGVINYLYNDGSWHSGIVTQFSNATAIPTIDFLFAHNFRMLAVATNSDRIYASDIGAASAAANWVATANVRIGKGEGDPIRAIVVNQAGSLFVLKGNAVWYLDTTDASVANWASRPVTFLTGCAAGRTAVAIGQDVFFLSQYGVMSLQALEILDSISPAISLSAPIQPIIDSINWASVSCAWATTWNNLYLLAVPTGTSTVPDTILVYNTLTKFWQPPWYSTAAGRTIAGSAFTLDGFTAGVVTNFGTKRETLFGDTCGRTYKLDPILDSDDNDDTTHTAITSWCLLKSWDFLSPESLKQPLVIECEWFRGTGRAVTIKLLKDSDIATESATEESVTVATAVQTSDAVVSNASTTSTTIFPIRFPFSLGSKAVFRLRSQIRDLGRFREASIQMICEQGRMQLRAARLWAFIDSPQIKP